MSDCDSSTLPGRGGGHCFLMAIDALLTFLVIDLTSLKNKESRILSSVLKYFLFFILLDFAMYVCKL